MKAESARWLITGGTGFLGRHLILALKGRGCFIRSFSLDPPMKVTDVAKLGIELYHGDIQDRLAFQKALDGIDIVAHLAGEKRNPDKFNLTNIEGTQRVLTACLNAGISHVIHMSSAGVIGCAPDDLITEETACHPQNDYEASKYQAEQAALQFHRQQGLPITILRPANVFGDLDPERHLLTLMLQIQKGRFRLIGRKEAWLNYVYAGDVAEACFLVSQDPKTAGQVYGLSDPCRMTEFVEKISKMLEVNLRPRRIPVFIAYGIALCFKAASGVAHRSWPLTIDKIRAFQSQTIYSAAKFKKEFPNWPLFGWQEGIKLTISWYRAQGWL
jgi:nucleoside-diphosphate-sugar epimerase